MVKSLLLGGEGAGRADEGEQSFSEIFVQRMSLVWQSVLPLAPTLGELSRSD